MKKLTSVIFSVYILSLLGCSSVSYREAFAPTPSPTPSPVSVSGEKCNIDAELFSLNGRMDFGECEVRRNAEFFNGKQSV